MHNDFILKTRNKNKIKKESIFIVPNTLADIFSCLKHKQDSVLNEMFLDLGMFRHFYWKTELGNLFLQCIS